MFMKGIRLVVAFVIALCFFAVETWGQSPSKQSKPEARSGYSLPDITAQKWTGDLDGMVKRRAIRVLVTYNKTHYFVDRGTQRGFVYDFFRLFEDDLNKKLKRKHVRVRVFLCL
jgi:hypothetical protein